MSDKVYFEQPLGDGSTLSVVNAFCEPLADMVPAIRFQFMMGDKMRTLEAFLVNATNKKPLYNELGRALLEIDVLPPNPIEEESEDAEDTVESEV